MLRSIGTITITHAVVVSSFNDLKSLVFVSLEQNLVRTDESKEHHQFLQHN